MSLDISMVEAALSSSTSISSQRYEIRIGFDMGSGSTKVRGVIFDTYKGEIEHELGRMNVGIGYQKDISDSNDGQTLTDEMQIYALGKLLGIVNVYKEYGVDTIKCAGIATAWARNAHNSDEYLGLLEKFGMYIKMISQKEEGEIGYRVAEHHFANSNDNGDLVVLDIGGGSFQLVHNEGYDLSVFNGPYGSSNFGKEVRDHVGNHNEFFNMEEVEVAREYASQNVNFDVIGGDDRVVSGIGQFLNLGIKGLVGKDYVELSDIENLIDEFSGITINEANIRYPDIGKDFMYPEQTNLLLLEAIMKSEGVEKINFVDAKSVDYVINEASFWESAEPFNYEAFSELVAVTQVDAA